VPPTSLLGGGADVRVFMGGQLGVPHLGVRMTLESLCFWLLVWVGVELLQVSYVTLHLALTLSSILGVVCLLLGAELELLGLVILATYASVFIALALLALHFGPFWLRAAGVGAPGSTRTLLLLGCLGGVGIVGTVGPVGGSQLSWVSVLWYDISTDLACRLGGYVGLTHWLFFRLFVIETLGLNLYLFVGLVVALALLAFRFSWLDAAGWLQASLRGRRASQPIPGDRIRLAAKFRRQTRRTNSTRLRQAGAV
jgi:hypothetical protein